MAFATTSLQGGSDEQRSWDLQLELEAPERWGPLPPRVVFRDVDDYQLLGDARWDAT